MVISVARAFAPKLRLRTLISARAVWCVVEDSVALRCWPVNPLTSINELPPHKREGPATRKGLFAR